MPFIVANWKMNKTLPAGIALVEQLQTYLQTNPLAQSIQLIIVPPFTHLQAISSLLAGSTNVLVGAQNCHHQSEGPFTGEVSAAMLASVGVRFVLIGHSERRLQHGEGHATIAAKINQALDHHLSPILCFGEPLQAWQEKRHTDFVCQQLQADVLHLTANQMRKVILAYEPVWAIGTGLTPTIEVVQAMQQAVRNFLSQHYPAELVETLPMLYGGSCNAHNIGQFVALSGIDGVLVGNASLDYDIFTNMIAIYTETCKKRQI